jgi:hypothetical protein
MRARSSGGLSNGSFHELEINLFFEAIDLANAHEQFVAQLDDPARSTPKQMVAGRFKNIKVVFQRGEMNQAA